MTYGSLCRGLLSGKMKLDTEFQGDDVRKIDPKFRPPRYAQYLKAVERLDRFAQENYGKGVLELAVRWTLDQPFVTVALWGARHPEQLTPIADVTGWKLDAAALKTINEIVREAIATRWVRNSWRRLRVRRKRRERLCNAALKLRHAGCAPRPRTFLRVRRTSSVDRRAGHIVRRDHAPGNLPIHQYSGRQCLPPTEM